MDKASMRVYKLHAKGEPVKDLAWFPYAMVPYTVAWVAPAGTLGEFNENDKHVRVSSRFIPIPNGTMTGAMQTRCFLPTWMLAYTRDD